MEWIDQDVARLEEDDELVENYLEQAKEYIQGRENAASLVSIRDELEQDLGPADDLGFKAVQHAVDKLEDDPDVNYYQDICQYPITPGAKQFYVE